MTTFLIEAVVLCLLFHLVIWRQAGKEPAKRIYSYPPAIVERYIELGRISGSSKGSAGSRRSYRTQVRSGKAARRGTGQTAKSAASVSAGPRGKEPGMNLTFEKQEAIMLFLYCGDNRSETISNLREMQTHLHVDEQDLRHMADSLIAKLQLIRDDEFLREHGFVTMEQLDAFISEKTERRDAILSSMRSAEKQITEIAALRKHIFNYANTRATYEAYRKTGYSRKFFEAHREEITIHKAAKKAFDELGVKRIPKVKDLNADYARLMAEKKQTFAEYRKARDEVKEYLIVRENISSLYEAERKENEADRKRQQEQER